VSPLGGLFGGRPAARRGSDPDRRAVGSGDRPAHET